MPILSKSTWIHGLVSVLGIALVVTNTGRAIKGKDLTGLIDALRPLTVKIVNQQRQQLDVQQKLYGVLLA